MRSNAAGFLFALVSLAACRDDPAQSNVIILLTDALRQDHLGIYGYPRDTSPTIDAFASDSVVFDNAVAQSSWTAPSVAALFTSEYPARLNPPKQANIQGIRTLAEWLSSNGYHTAAFVSNPLIRKNGGYAQGFDSFQYLKHARAFRLVNRAVTWIDELDDASPFFLYLHFMDMHDPYRPPPPHDTQFSEDYDGPVDGWIGTYQSLMSEHEEIEMAPRDREQLLALYDGGIAYFDSQFARLIRALKDRGLVEKTIVVLVADHGDEFLDHGGMGHGHSLFDELIHVPLVISGVQGKQGTRYRGVVELIDLAPTLAQMSGIPFDYDVTGRSFLSHVEQNRAFKDYAFSEVRRTAGSAAGTWYVSARSAGSKLVYSPLARRYQYFDLANDPDEVAPHTSDPEMAKTTLDAWRGRYGARPEPDEYDPETVEAMRALGYIP